MQIKVLSWNIWRGNHLDEIISFLKSANADIIGLQEIHVTQTENFAQIIAEGLGYEFAFCKAFRTTKHNPPYDYGNAILSRFPIERTVCHQLSGLDDYTGDSSTEPRGAIEAAFTIGEKRLHVFNTHLAYSHQLISSELRSKQIHNLVSHVKDTNTIVMGDFNATPDKEEMQYLASKIPNADPHPVKGTWSVHPVEYHGFAVKGLEYRIDHLFVSPDLAVKDFRVEEQATGSDHLPVSTIIEV